jgi:hypothetical protein
LDGEVIVHGLIVEEILFDGITAVSQAENELPVAVVGVAFHNVPENGTASHFDHRLGAKLRLFPETGTQTTAQDYDFHRKELLYEGDELIIISQACWR